MSFKFKKSLFICILSAIMLGTMIVTFGTFKTARAAEIDTEDYKVTGVAIRLVNDEYGTGVKFTAKISKSKFDSLTNAKTAVLIMPEAFIDGEITADSADVLKIETTAHKENGDYYESAAYIYDIPAASFGLKLVARGYLTYEENGETKEYYTAATKAYSLTDVALSAPDGLKEEVKDYIVDKATITFKNGDTQLDRIEFNYGEKITYPSVAVGADKYVEWRTSKNTVWDAEWTAQQNLTLTANYVDCFGYKVEDCLYSNCPDDVGGDPCFVKSETAAPVGFENVYEKTSNFNTSSYPDGYLHGRMSHASIAAYSEVRFAIKSSAYFIIDKDGYTGSFDKERFDGWLLFKLTQKPDGVWHINISHNGVVIRDFDDNTARTDICNILWHGRAGGITPVGDENGLTVYCTEIRAEYGNRVVSGEVVTDTLYEDNKDGSVMENVTAENAKTPCGFAKVWRHKMSVTDMHGKMFSGKDISDYASVRFALKSSGTICVGGNYLKGGIWVYVTLTQNSDKTWNLKAEQNGVEICSYKNLSAALKDGQENVYTANSLNAILYAGDYFTLYPHVANVGDYIYYTEVRGELPEKPIIGEIVDEKFMNANGVTDEETTEAIPSGYEKVRQYKGMSNEGFIHGMFYSAIPLNEYSSVNFAIKTTGSFQLNSEAYAPANEWLYFNLVQNGDNTWNVTVEDRRGNVVHTCSNLNGYKGDNHGVYTDYALNAILYGYTKIGYTIYGNADTVTYCTEVRGVLKPRQLTRIAVASRYEDETSDRAEDAIINYYAIKEAQKWLGEFANIDGIEYITDESALSSSVYYIVLGNAFSNGDYAGLTTDTGYKIVKRDGSVYLYGKTGYGTLNALYGFLKQRYNLEIYADTVYTFSDAGEVCYEDIEEETFNPSIDYNLAYDGPLTHIKEGEVNPNYDYQRRLGFVDSWQQIGGTWHNFLDYVPQSEYGSTHPEWYTAACDGDGKSNGAITLDLTSGGDAMAKIVADKIKAQVEADEEGQNIKPVYVFGPPDSRTWSDSSATKSTVAKYGTRSAEYILFMNKVAKILDDDYTFGRQIKLCLLAYNLVCDAPDFNDDLKFYRGDEISLNVMFAPIEANAYRAANDSTPNFKYHLSNAHFAEQFAKWKAFGGEVYYWNYSEYFDNYFVMLDTVTNMQSKYKLMAENGVNRLIDLGMVGDDYGTDFTALKIYLKGKLARNVNENVDALIKNFCDAYYGAGGEDIYNLLKAEQVRYKKVADLSAKANNGEDAVGIHVVRDGVAVKSYWDEKEFNTLYGYINSALAAIDNSSENEEAKAEYKKRVVREGIAVRYMKYYVFNSFVTLANGNTDSIAAMISDAKSVDITRFAEGTAYVWKSRLLGKWQLVDGDINNLA